MVKRLWEHSCPVLVSEIFWADVIESVNNIPLSPIDVIFLEHSCPNFTGVCETFCIEQVD